MSEAGCQLLFDGFVAENEETLKRFKAACIVDLELSVEDVTAIINNERSIIRVGSRSELEPLKDLLIRIGAKVSLMGDDENSKGGTDSATTNQDEEESEDTLVFEFDELEISGPPTPAKPKETKAYVLDIDEEQKEEDIEVLKVDAPGLDFHAIPIDGELDLLASTVELTAPKIEPLPSIVTDKIPKPIVPIAPTEALELTLGPAPVEVKVTETAREESEEDFEIEMPEEEVESCEGLSFTTIEEQPLTPAPSQRKNALPPESAPEIKTQAPEPVFEIPAAVIPVVKETVAPKPAVQNNQEVKAKEKEKEEPPVQAQEEADADQTTKKKKKLKNFSFDSEFSFSKNQVIGLFVLGLVFLAGTNFLFTADPSADIPELAIPQLPPEPIPEKKADEKKNNFPKQPQWSGTQKNTNSALFISLNEGAKSSLLLKVSGSTTAPPALTPEEIVKKVQPRPWLRRIDGEPIVLVSESPTKLSGSGIVFGFIEQGDIRKRIPLNILAQIEMKDDRTSAAAQIVISYLPNNETTLPAKGKVIESAPNDSYRIALEADLELTQK